VVNRLPGVVNSTKVSHPCVIADDTGMRYFCARGKRAVLWFLMMRYVLPESSVPDLDDGWLMADDNGPELDERLLASPLQQE